MDYLSKQIRLDNLPKNISNISQIGLNSFGVSYHNRCLIIFNLMYLPALFLFPKLLFAGEISGILLLVFAAGGQVALFLFDQAYDYFLIRLWEQVREKLFGRR